MAGPTERPVVAVCGGKDCARTRRDEHRALLEILADVEVVPTACLDVCDGPVAVLDPTGEAPVVVERVRKGKHRRALVDVLAGRPARKPFRSRVITGKAARTARKKAGKALQRRR
ncbi:MAG: hypothetical protein ACLGIC_08805 [Acidimicrobiia bacterium]